MSDQQPDTHEHYNADYQKTVELERLIFNGMPAEEVYAKETAFAMRAADVSEEDFDEDEGIVDIASGAGNHAFAMSDALNHNVPITVTDPSKELGAMAEEKFQQRHTHGVKEQIHFVFDADKAKMQNMTKEESQQKKVKLITVLGYSFAYTNVRESEQALSNMYDMLEPGGKIVIQWRQRPNERDAAQIEREKKTEDLARGFGVEGHQGELDGKDRYYWTGPKGEKYYFTDADCECPDPDRADEYERIESEAGVQWRHKDTGIRSFAYSRVLHDEDSQRIDYPTATIHQTCWEYEDRGVQPLTGLLRRAGFSHIGFRQPESEDDWLGKHRMLAVVATKAA